MRVHELLESRVEKTPDADYLTCPGADTETWTFSEIATEAKRYANAFADVGVEKNDSIAIFLPNRAEYLITLFASTYLGAVTACPHPSYKAPELRHSISLSEPKVLVVDADRREYAETTIEGTSVEAVFCVDDVSGTDHLPDIAAGHHPTITTPDGSEDDVGFHLYTSGTTGPPKAVAESHRAWVSSTMHTAKWLRYTPRDTLLNVFPLAHANAQVHTAMGAVAGGSEAVFFDDFSVSAWWDWCNDHDVTVFNTMGSMLKMLLSQPESEDDTDNDVRAVYSAGSSAELIQQFEERFDLRICEVYGLTECTKTSINPPDVDQRRLGSQGLPAPESRVRIVDENDNVLPPNTAGQITIKDPSVMERYHGNSEKTAETIRDGWLYTGDIGKLDEDGYLYFLDRMDDAIRRSGENISSYEVESVIGELEAVAEVAVIPVPDEVRGQEIKALVKPKGNVDLNPEEIVEACRTNLAEFKVPRYVEFFADFSYTETEKIQKSDLKEREEIESPDHWDRYEHES